MKSSCRVNNYGDARKNWNLPVSNVISMKLEFSPLSACNAQAGTDNTVVSEKAIL